MGGASTPPASNGTDNIRLTIGSRLELLSMVHAVISQICDQRSLDDTVRDALLIAVIEAGTNAIQHGNAFAADKSVEFDFQVNAGEIVIEVDDYGTGFDAARVANPTDASSLLNPHGRGLYLMRELMDEVTFDVRPDNGTRVRLRKSFASATD
ncbi:MAG TPA: ATP-binding protein [Candidatus Eisenbacteria bacterium]|nr:ATP-binding protein [Candidatus Eisenbacteria bacterium]